MSSGAELPAPEPGATITASGEGGVHGEIYSMERLEAHAVDMARAHGKPVLDVRARPLLTSFQATRKAIEGAYDALAKKAQKRSDATPAEEWLLDNSHVIDDQLHEIEEDLPSGYLMKLPRLTKGASAGYPRVYALALDFIGHTDGRIDLESLVRYVTAYQSVGALTIGELWAVPIMLRLGLAESVRKLADQELSTGEDRARADTWVVRMLKGGPRRSTDVAIAMAELAVSDEAFKPAFVVQLLRRLREHDAVVASAFHWIQERCAEMGLLPEELTRLEHLRQASAQVSIGNAITSMRVIAALDWGKFFERTSEVEHVLREDPSRRLRRDRRRVARTATGTPSRTSRRGASSTSWRWPARRSIAPRRPRPPRVRGRAQAGRPTSGITWWTRAGTSSSARCATGPPWARASVARSPRGRPPRTSAPSGSGRSAAWAALLVLARDLEHPSRALLVALALLLALPCSEVAITLINWIVTAALPPRILTKLSFEKGIPASCRTLVGRPGPDRQRGGAQRAPRGPRGAIAGQPRGQRPLRAAHGLPRRRRRGAPRRGRAAGRGPAGHRRPQRAPGGGPQGPLPPAPPPEAVQRGGPPLDGVGAEARQARGAEPAPA